MGLAKQFKTDDNLETKGIVLDYGDARIRIARAGGANKRFAKALEKKVKPYRKALAAEAMDNELQNNLLKQVYADTVVLGWQANMGENEEGETIWQDGIDPEDAGVTDHNAPVLPVNPENILRVFKNLPDLFSDIVQQAQAVALFRAEIDKEVEKN